MTNYNKFIGIDIGKDSFFVNTHESKAVKKYANTSTGIDKFIDDYQPVLSNHALCILETTGGYEMNVLFRLCHQKLAVVRANACKVKHFIRSYGHAAKTDVLDAKALALYGYERGTGLKCYSVASDHMLELYELTARHHDLKKMLVGEKNRLQAPRTLLTKDSCISIIEAIEGEIEKLHHRINFLIENDSELKLKKLALKSIPGIGDIIANNLIALLPELGTLNRRQIASLVGLAPKANDSGKYTGYRSTGHGRAGIKPNLFLGAMAARNSNSKLKPYYEGLIARGKKKKVALTALMRKMIVIANAKLRDLQQPTANAEDTIRA